MGEMAVVFKLQFSRPVAMGLPLHKIRIDTRMESGPTITILLLCLLLCKQSLKLTTNNCINSPVIATHHNFLNLCDIFLSIYMTVLSGILKPLANICSTRC